MDRDQIFRPVIERAESVGISAEVRRLPQYSDSSEPKNVLELSLPNGRDKRLAIVTEDSIQTYLSSNFEHYTVLGSYIAFLDKSTRTIEAFVRGAGTQLIGPAIRRLVERNVAPHGNNALVRISDEDQSGGILGIEDDSVKEDSDWHLEISTPDDGIKLELLEHSSNISIVGSSQFPGFFGRNRKHGPCLKISGIPYTTHDDAVAALEKYSTSLFFEIDLRHNISLMIARARPLRTFRSARTSARVEVISALSNVYAPEAVAMYSYGRSATGMPLLQFLAFYQSVEFFFPSFSNSATLRRLRLHLKDPRFDRESDAALQRLVAIARGSARGTVSEKEQLRTTLEESLEEAELRELVSSYANLSAPEKGRAIRGVNNLKLHASDRMIDQVAERIYKIRCRIVHTKDSGGGSSVDVLLPFGAEADALHEDILLMRHVAQKVIIAGSRGSF